MKRRWDIFCKVVDNFGDIGVCWRLARQLQTEFHLEVRLWVDDLSVAQRLIPQIGFDQDNQCIEGIMISRWHDSTEYAQAAEVVIEAFACGLPSAYVDAMKIQHSTWVNLDYLSAEPWVEEFHAKSSPQVNGLVRHFYFPGFSPATGGLIREQHLTMPPATSPHPHTLSLFCYPHAPIHVLLQSISDGITPLLCYVPATSILPQVADFFTLECLEPGQVINKGNLTVEVLPFLTQTEYDKLLANCDINFVRGEDSWVRAIWAGNPFIWQPYQQEDGAHLPKLQAFLAIFYSALSVEQRNAVEAMHRAWVTPALVPEIWTNYLRAWPDICVATQQASRSLFSQDDLASKLVIFCNNL